MPLGNSSETPGLTILKMQQVAAQWLSFAVNLSGCNDKHNVCSIFTSLSLLNQRFLSKQRFMFGDVLRTISSRALDT
jgi:hypothetical protein